MDPKDEKRTADQPDPPSKEALEQADGDPSLARFLERQNRVKPIEDE